MDINVNKQYFELIEDFFIVSKTDIYGNITYVNDNFCNISGYTKDELIGKPHNIVRHPETPKYVFEEMWDTIKNKKQIFSYIIKNKKKNGKGYWLKSVIKPILNDDGDIIEFISIRQDVTKEIEYNNNLFKTIVENMSESVWIGDKYEKTIYANPNFCDLLGYDVEEIIGKESYMFWDNFSAQIVRENNNIRKKGKKSKYEGNLITKNGEKIPVFLSLAPMKDGGSVGIMTDLRELKSVKKLAEYQKAIEGSNILLKISPNYNITYANQIFFKASKIKKDNILNKYYFDILDIDSHLKNEIKLSLENKKVRRGELKLNVNDVDYFSWAFTNIIPLFSKNGELEEFLVLKNNITKEKQYETKIQNDKNHIIKKLEEINKTKDEFINIVSHELRTPMTTIKGYISMILEGDAGDINDEVKIYLNKIITNSQRLIYLINDILDVQKLESGKMNFNFTKFDFVKLLDEVYFDMLNLAKKNNQKLLLNNDFKSLYIICDRNKLIQVLVNLINNSIKFTPKGGEINIISKINGDFLEICVVDTGIGISEDDLNKIFEKFGQVKNSLTRDIEGTGLGLFIVKSIIENLGGKINIESKLGVGTKFYFSILINN
ncbi:PAS domain-containing sensor histidine kinase [Candidatus Vampirococcus lugosii]|uniref:histidine kinase n=1 Tax=Candidatus Vampirococcus lugosii TaxID=2789015 RepID=A0ABS5QLK6_9BACT|nr:PAS domain-containing sensor histidine kinase [Candidatus Vampirococcus lugosii]MBS8121947.1 Signal transduction histidine kinase [Candidatus Vampirococcus lugosii]